MEDSAQGLQGMRLDIGTLPGFAAGQAKHCCPGDGRSVPTHIGDQRGCLVGIDDKLTEDAELELRSSIVAADE